MTTRFQRFALAILVPILVVVGLSFLARTPANQEQTDMIRFNLSLDQQNTVLLTTLRLSGVPIASAGLTDGNPDGSGRVAVIGATVGAERDANLFKVITSAAGVLQSGQVQFDGLMIAYSEDGKQTTGIANLSGDDLRLFIQGKLSPNQLMSRVRFSVPPK